MPQILEEIIIDASPEIVWTMLVRHLEYPDYVSRGPEWDSLVIKDIRGESLSLDRKGVGVKTRWYYKFYWYTFKWDDEVIEWEEKKRITWKALSTWKMIDSFTIYSQQKETRLVYEMDYTPPYGVMGRIWYKLFVHGHLDKNVKYTMLQMKRNAEKISTLNQRE
jgi:hypothetical protein